MLYKSLGSKQILYKENIVLDFNIKNKSQQQSFYLVSIQPVLDSLVFSVNGVVSYLGDKVNYKIKPIRNYNAVGYFKIPQDSSVDLKIIIKSQDEQLNYKLLLVEQNTFLKTSNRDSLLFGFFIGLFFMFLLMLASMYQFSKNTFFNKYIFINVITIFIYIYFSGFGYQLLWWKWNWMQVVLPSVLFALYTFAHIIFLKGFFYVKVEFPKLNRLLNIFGFLLVAFVVYSLVFILFAIKNSIYFSIFINTIYTLFVVYVFIALFIAFYSYYKIRRRESLWVIIGMLIQLVGWLVFFNTLFLSIPIFNKVSNLKLFNSFIFISQFNFILYILEFILITFFISYNYKQIIVMNDVSYTRLNKLQEQNLKSYLLGLENTRISINRYLRETILKDIKQIKSKFEELMFFKEVTKLNTHISNDFINMENDLNHIMNDNILVGISNISLYNLIEHILQRTPDSMKFVLLENNSIADLKCSDVFNNHIYRIIQELINNTIKHSSSKSVVISIAVEQRQLIINYKDEGSKHNKQTTIKGLGLLNIEDRLKEFDGKLDVLNTEHWEVNILVPLKNILR